MAAITAAALARRLASLGAAVPAEFRKTARGLGIAAVKFTRERMTQEIYAIPEDVTGGPVAGAAGLPGTGRPAQRAGRKKWRRTGRLRSSERYEVRSPYLVAILNDTPYAVPRHEAGKPGKRRINPARESHWRDELLKTFGPIVREANRLTLLALLQRGRR